VQESRPSLALFAALRQMIHNAVTRSEPLQKLRHGGVPIFAAGALVCAVAAPSAAATQPVPRVRSTDATILHLLQEGAERSTTFRSLVDAIDHSTGIVYVEFGYCAFGHLNGCLLPFIAVSHGDRYLRIVVTADQNRRSHDQLLALLAHEMRHALEVLEHPEVVDVATMEAMYRKIGTPLTGHSGHETSAARAAGDAVLAELSEKHPWLGVARLTKPQRQEGRLAENKKVPASLPRVPCPGSFDTGCVTLERRPDEESRTVRVRLTRNLATPQRYRPVWIRTPWCLSAQPGGVLRLSGDSSGIPSTSTFVTSRRVMQSVFAAR
jgi:hypothetical protein